MRRELTLGGFFDRTNVSIYALMDGQEVRSSAMVLAQQGQPVSKTIPRVVRIRVS